ncbi:hypothetical protein B9G38_17275, partial [Halorubrum sp. SD612]
MIRRLRRAGIFAAVAALAALAPTLDAAAAVPFFAVAGAAFFGVRDGEWFETLALPGDREAERLYGLVSFALAGAGLALFASLPRAPLPDEAFAAATLAVGAGRLGRTLVSRRTTDEFPLVAGYVAAGTAAALLGQVAVRLQTDAPVDGATVPLLVFLAAAAALTAALVRSLVFSRDAHITTILVAFVTWGFLALEPAGDPPPTVSYSHPRP